MNVINFISYINFFAIFLFIVVSFFLGYQLYLLKKDFKKEKKITKLPDFKENVNQHITTDYQNVTLNKEEKKVYKKNRIFNIIITLFFLILIGFFLLFNFTTKKNGEKKTISPSQIKYIASSGIKIYNENWEEVRDDFGELKPGIKVYIGIEKLDLEDIDKARIRVNKNVWEADDVTDLFNSEKKIFYKEYYIASNEGILRIEAQLHSKIDGWLGE